MQKQALKGLFFNISTWFSPHLEDFIIRYTLSAQSPLSLRPTIAFWFVSKRSNSFQFLQDWKELHNFVMTFKGK